MGLHPITTHPEAAGQPCPIRYAQKYILLTFTSDYMSPPTKGYFESGNGLKTFQKLCYWNLLWMFITLWKAWYSMILWDGHLAENWNIFLKVFHGEFLVKTGVILSISWSYEWPPVRGWRGIPTSSATSPRGSRSRGGHLTGPNTLPATTSLIKCKVLKSYFENCSSIDKNDTWIDMKFCFSLDNDERF